MLPKKVQGMSAKVFRPERHPRDPLKDDVPRIAALLRQLQLAPAHAAQRAQQRAGAARAAAADAAAGGASTRELRDFAWRDQAIAELASVTRAPALSVEARQQRVAAFQADCTGELGARPSSQPLKGHVFTGATAPPRTAAVRHAAACSCGQPMTWNMKHCLLFALHTDARSGTELTH
jgi:integrase